jgi:hypothetical protein
MCHNWQVSISTWLVCVGIAGFLYKRNHIDDHWLALFLLTYSFIQFLEALIWLNINNQKVLQILVHAILIALWFQPIVNTACAYSKINSPVLSGLFIICVFFGLYTIFSSIGDQFTAFKGPNCHLIWQHNENSHIFLNSKVMEIIYMIGLLIPLFYISNIQTRITALATLLITYLFSIYYYKAEFSTMWCWTAAILGGLFIWVN